ncbi:TetR/AcrR family transcriptional regulator [Formosa haliotis]|uniref:TetR/AcrR family transcriptional regulator n=1 Tax=Formosa haliotis TaxID=1555194 RepID=UPI000826526F|nr:TetR/AcrR family transcriptional regulator [Formosa haliotis]
MKDKIIAKSEQLFTNLGFKSVTMDDIASELGISKKTIYQYFETKTKLVEATASFKFNCINKSINSIFKQDINPIDEIFEMKHFILTHLNDERPSAQYQFKKYYPKIFTVLKQKQFNVMKECISGNLDRGIKAGLYRSSVNIDFISRMYFNFLVSIKDHELFPQELFTPQDLLNNFLDYHLRGICSEKGLEYLKTNHKTIKNN